MQKPVNFKLCTPFNERALIGRNPVGKSKKRGKERIKQKSKVFTVDIQIKQSVLRVSNSEVFSSEV